MSLPNENQNFTAFDPLPASELNDMVENIEALSDGSGLEDGAVPADKIGDSAGFKLIGTSVLGSNSDTLTITDLPTFRHLLFEYFIIATGGTIRAVLRFNNDSGSNYGQSRASNFGTEGTSSSANILLVDPATSAQDNYGTGKAINIANRPKLIIVDSVKMGTSGATVPVHRKSYNKWNNTSSAITQINIIKDDGTGTFAAGSEIRVFGQN